MNRRTFFGALLGTAAVGTVSGSKTVAASPDKFITRFTLKTKHGDYYFYWTGWKKTISQVVNVGQWIAEPVDGLEYSGGLHAFYVREHPAFYATTTGTMGPISNMNNVMDLTYQEDFPLITDKSTVDEKWEAQDEALHRLIKYIEEWELPEFKYVGNGHISDRSKLRPGALIDGDFPLSETLSRVLKEDGLTARAFKKVVKGV